MFTFDSEEYLNKEYINNNYFFMYSSIAPIRFRITEEFNIIRIRKNTCRNCTHKWLYLPDQCPQYYNNILSTWGNTNARMPLTWNLHCRIVFEFESNLKLVKRSYFSYSIWKIRYANRNTEISSCTV